MKANIIAKSSFAILTLAMGIFVNSCDDDDDQPMANKMYTISGNASGAQEVPPNSSTATGSISGTFNAETNLLTYTISWSGLSGDVVAAHFHGPALAGVSANPMVDITLGSGGAYSGTSVSNSVTLVDSAETHLLNGRLYYNLHTALNPGGEIRGQVTASPQ